MIQNKTNILFLLTLQPNPRFVKQINYLSSEFNVSVLFFSRNSMIDYSKLINQNVTQVNLGKIKNGKYFSRVLIFLSSIFKIRKFMRQRNTSHIILDKFDSLILFLLVKSIFHKGTIRIKTFIEVPDLKPIQFSTSLKASLFRIIENKVMNQYVDKLIITSPMYFTSYYKQFYKGRVFILENKPLKENLPEIKHERTSLIDNNTFTIGIIGGLNRGRPTKIILDYAVRNSWLKLRIHGLGPNEHNINEYSKSCNNIDFFGSFNFFNDSSEIYKNIDAAYVVYDTTNVSLNTKYALPNKLYECMYFKVPLIVSKDTFLSDIVLEYGIGIAIDFRNVNESFNEVKKLKENYKMYLNNFKNLSESNYLADIDYKKFLDFIFN